MSMWQEGKLKDFIVLKRGHDLTDEQHKQGEYPVVKSNGVDGFHNEYKCEAPGVVTGRSGTIGNVFYIEQDFWPHNTTLYVKDFKGNDKKYIYYLLQVLRFDKYYAGTTVPTLNRNDVHKIKLSVPEPTEQRTIATILSKVDEAIAATKNNIAKAERLKKALMQNLLTGKLKPDGTWRKENEFYKDEKFGNLPIGWNIKRMNEIFYINRNTLSAKTNPDYLFNYVTIEAVFTERIEWNAVTKEIFKDAPGRARRKIKDGDILISTVRPNLKSFTVFNKPREIQGECVCSTGFNVLEPKENQDRDFFFYQLLSKIGETQFHSFVAGSNYPAINDRDFNRILFYEAPYREQVAIGNQIAKISTFNLKKQTKIKKLERLKKALMQNLLTGKVRAKVP